MRLNIIGKSKGRVILNASIEVPRECDDIRSYVDKNFSYSPCDEYEFQNVSLDYDEMPVRPITEEVTPFSTDDYHPYPGEHLGEFINRVMLCSEMHDKGLL